MQESIYNLVLANSLVPHQQQVLPKSKISGHVLKDVKVLEQWVIKEDQYMYLLTHSEVLDTVAIKITTHPSEVYIWMSLIAGLENGLEQWNGLQHIRIYF